METIKEREHYLWPSTSFPNIRTHIEAVPCGRVTQYVGFDSILHRLLWVIHPERQAPLPLHHTLINANVLAWLIHLLELFHNVIQHWANFVHFVRCIL